MQNLMTPRLAETFAADAERRWLYGHPYRVERSPRRARATVRRAGRVRRAVTARRLRTV